MGSIAGAVYGVDSSPERATFKWGFAVTSLLLGLAASLAGAWFPARAAARLNPVLALHNVETRQTEAVFGWGRTLAGATLSVAGLLLIRFAPVRFGLTVQFVYAATVLLGLTLLLPRFVRLAARLLRLPMDRVAGSEGALAMDAILQAPRRSSATVGALMVGLMFVFSTAAYIQSYRRVIDRWMGQVLNADLFVAASPFLRSPTSHFSEDLGRNIVQLDGVQSVENVRLTVVSYGHDTVTLTAIEMAGFLARAGDAIEGEPRKILKASLPRGEGFVVSRNFAARWGIALGQPVRLETPTGPLARPVLGVVDDYRSEKGTIFLDRALYKSRWGDSAVDFVDVNLAPGADAAKIKGELQRLTANNLRAFIYTNGEFKRWVSGLVDRFFLLNYMQLVIAVLVAMLGILNTLLISVAERQREIGIVRAIGGLRSQVRKLVLLEAVAISLAGVLAGALAAVFNTEFLTHTVSGLLAGYYIPFYFPWALVLASVPVAMAASLLAGWWPARRAARLPVIEAIGYE
jgi:putative ABC transport system permease protein